MQQPPTPQRATHQPPAPPSGGGGTGLLAALTLLLVAYTNFSLAGLLLLLAFLAWGAMAATAEQQTAKRLWAAVSGLSAMGLLLQLGVQAAFLLGAPGLGATAPFLKVLGFPHAESLAGVLLAVVPMMLVLLASAAQVQAARDSGQQQRQRQSEGTELQPLTRQQLWQRGLPRAFHAPSYSLSGAAVGAALLAAAIAQPSVLAAPYMLAATAAVWRWSGTSSSRGVGGGRGRARRRALLQTYTAAYLVALYAWQAVLHGWALLQPLAEVLGLFTLTADEDQGWQQLLPAAVQLASLLLLYLALGAAHGGGAPREAGPAPVDAWDGSPAGERSPLLQASPRPPHAVARAVQASSWPQLLYLLLLEAVELVCSRPAAVAATLACTALLQPSLLGGCMLLIGLSALLARWAASALQHARRPLAALLLAWQLACYGATVAARVMQLPPVAEAVGIHAFGAAAWLPLLIMLVAAAATAGPATAPRGRGSPLSSSNLLLLQLQEQHRQQVPPRLQSLFVRMGSLRPARNSPAVSSTAGPSEPISPTAGAGGAAALPPAAPDSLGAAAPWLVAWNLLLRLLHYCGFLAVPALLFVVGAAQYVVLHGLYLAGLLAWLAGRTLHLKPSLSTAILDGTGHCLLRTYSSLHLAAVYAACVGGLPGFCAILQPEGLQPLLSAIGLWHPSVAAGMLPVLALLLMATLHGHVAAAVHGTAREQYCSDVDGVSTWHPAALVYTSRLAVAYGPASIVALGYCLLLLDCDIALLGLGYLLLLAALLLHQPPRSRWEEPAGAGAAGSSTQERQQAMSSSVLPTVMQGLVQRIPGSRRVRLASPTRSWLPLMLLAAYAACDFAAQALLPAAAAAAAAGWFELPDDILAFLRAVVGLSEQAHGLQLALRLLRPLLLLAATSTYRCCYCLGTLHKQLQHQAMPQAVLAAHRLHAQLGWKSLGKRLLILHGSKAVGLLVFAAAMQHSGAVGWLLTAGVVALAPLLGAPRSGTTCRQPLLRAGLQSAAAVAGAWMVAQYALCVPWLQALLMQLSPSALDWAQWAGLLVPPDPGPDSGSGAGELERLLRVKCLLLVAVALKTRAFRWQSKLPQQLRSAGRCGSPCPLFWPTSPTYQPPPLDGALSPGTPGPHQLGALSLLGSLHRAATAVLSRAQHTTQQALRAIDWPAGQSIAEEGAGEGAAIPEPATPTSRLAAAPAAAEPSAAAAPACRAADSDAFVAAVYRRRQQWRLLRFAAQDWVERAWEDWSLDICCLLLLLAAFAAANALSLAHMAAIAAGMALPSSKQQCVWRWLVVPMLATLLLYQYAVLMGPPPTWPWGMLLALWLGGAANLPPLAPDVQEWLGLGAVDAAALWLLYLSYGACVLHMHYASWARCARQRQHHHQQEAEGVLEEGSRQSDSGSLSRASSFDGIESAQPSQSAPLLPRADRSSASGGPRREEQQEPPLPSPRHTTLQVTVSSPPEPAGGAPASDAPLLWQPLALPAQKQWAWHDWARYMVYRHYLDFLLVCVVALCTLENDLLHAGYLALALAFFRSRIALRIRRNSLFWWLPLFNFLVMVLTLVYQAPLQLLLPPRHPDPAFKACSWAHILGLFRLDPGESLLSLGYRGAMADVLLWAFIRLQTHIFASGTYDRVIAVVQQEEQEEKRDLEEQVAGWKQKQAAAAVEESQQRAARRQRVERLKAAATGSFAAGVDTVQQLYAFLVPQHRQQAPQPAEAGPAQAAPPPPPSVPHAVSSAGLTEYEREMLAANSVAGAEPQQPGAQASSAPATPGAAGVAAAAAAAAAGQGRHVGGRLRAWVRHNLRRADRNSYVCYILFCIAFLSDCSLLTLAMPLSAFAYALVSIKPSGTYWQMILVYCEAIIVTQYAFMVPEQLRCDFISPIVQHNADVLGIHGDPLRALPIFLVYLATLKHHYSLATRHAARQAAAAAAAATTSQTDLEAGPVANGDAGAQGGRAARAGVRQDSSRQYLGETLGSTVSSSLQRIGLGLLEGSTTAWEFLLRCCTVSERPPHFLLVTVAVPPSPAPADAGLQAPSHGSREEQLRGQQMQEHLQQILDGCRRTDIAAARERQERQRLLNFGFGGGAGEQAELSSRASIYEAPLTFEAPATASGQHASRGSAAATAFPGQQPLRVAQSTGVVDMLGSRQATYPDLSTVGPLQLSFISFVAAPGGSEAPAQLTSATSQGSSMGEGSGGSPGAAGAPGGDGTATALFEVVAVKSTPDNSSGWCSVAGWPLRSLNPARHAAATLLRYQQATRGLPLVPQQQSPSAAAQLDLDILDAEYHSRQPQDWYAATTALDFGAWVYVVLQYNAVVTSARSLSEITSEHVVPLDYLLTVMLLFMLLVAERVFYTVGSPLGKALLHLGEMVMYTWYCLVLFWSPLTSSGARTHLRILLALKCASFALGALQLRSGYPPRADSSNGMGRHTFWFMRRVTTARAVAFNVFLALPFVYELRQLLDWALTPTTLTLFDWLKLEEINVSLFFVTWNRKLRATKRLGDRQPRYAKFLQGTLLFAGLLLLLWVPLLLFSSGAPTYTVPAVTAFSTNATLSTSDAASPPATRAGAVRRFRHLAAATAAAAGLAAEAGVAAAASAEFPAFDGGRRRQRQQWLPYDAGMPDELATYSAQQFQLLCTSADADRYWDITPPAQQELQQALVAGGEGEPAGGGVSLSLGWTIQRNLPPPSDHGGPVCQSSLVIPLAPSCQQQLAAVLNGTAESAQLLRSDPSGGGGGSSQAALYPLVWMMRGDVCTSRPLRLGDVPGGAAAGASFDWASRWVACNASLLPPPEPAPPEPEPPEPAPEPPSPDTLGGPHLSSSSSSGAAASARQRRRLAAVGDRAGALGDGASLASWWHLECWIVNASGSPIQPGEEVQEAECGATFGGPRLVAVLERVQGGIIGQTLSKYGIAGLFSIVVLSVGRFLRLSLSNMRAKIPFEDLPNTRRLVGLCQDIYIARAEGELALEEQLYWSLVNIYRLPSVLFELTKKPQ